MDKKDNVLPSDFDGTFRFTNWTKEDFLARWDNVEYTFLAETSTPMIIPSASPEQVQYIRKKFAKELAEREFYKSPELKRLDKQNTQALSSFRTAVTYNEGDLTQYIQKCLEPLTKGTAKVKKLPNDERSFHTDDEGEPVSVIIEGKANGIKSLRNGPVVA